MKPGILAIDIGGTGLKASVLDGHGGLRNEPVRVDTPHPCPPQKLVDAVVALVQGLEHYDRISIGFPGVVRSGKVITAPNLDTELWAGFALAESLSSRLGGFPARLINDAEMQGFALIRGVGLELAVTLGTGVGTALFRDGALMPHMELGQHPARHRKTYDEYLGEVAFKHLGRKHWNKRVRRALKQFDRLLNPDHIVLGGGNSRHVDGELPTSVTIGSNTAGIQGGAALWSDRNEGSFA